MAPSSGSCGRAAVAPRRGDTRRRSGDGCTVATPATMEVFAEPVDAAVIPPV
jgi:hypothetical protein